MTKLDFIPSNFTIKSGTGEFTCQAPSNIALVKYWGKLEDQIPANPSISFTLDNCKSITTLKYKDKDTANSNIEFDFYFEGKEKEDFKPKISEFFERIKEYCPYLTQYHFTISSENTFPHSSGIASSASGMSALALCLMNLERDLTPDMSEEYFKRKASFLARLGSGSASRSIDGKLVVWGKHSAIKDSSDLYAVPLQKQVHEKFKNYQDTILLVDKGEKQVSSSAGHHLMHGHPFAESRFQQANDNLERLISVLEKGDIDDFIKIVEGEALSLHAMMMSSQPYFILIKPNTLEIINRIWAFRRNSGIPACFTLDAGANVHLLYPEIHKDAVLEFISNELVAYCQNGHYICDQVGDGAKLL